MLFLDDLEDIFIKENVINVGLKTISDQLENKINIFLNLFVILYTGGTGLMDESASEQQTLLDTFYRYCFT